MGQGKDNYVCCDCRERTRRAGFGHNKTPRCPRCGKLMASVGQDFRTPKKTDDKGWAEVRDRVRRLRFQSRYLYDQSLKWLERQHMFKKGRT